MMIDTQNIIIQLQSLSIMKACKKCHKHAMSCESYSLEYLTNEKIGLPVTDKHTFLMGNLKVTM
jgi:hypothetical protein